MIKILLPMALLPLTLLGPSRTVLAASDVSITGPGVLAVGDTIELTAVGSPPGGTFAWLVQPERTAAPPGTRVSLVDPRVRGRADGATLRLTGLAPSAATGDVRVRVLYEVGGTTVRRDHVLTCVSGDLRAFRPRHGAGYFPFARTPVAESDEEDPALGPGIRVHGATDVDPAGEDDLIEVEVTTAPTTSYVLRRGTPDLAVWTTSDRSPGTEVAFAGGVTGSLTASTVFVEWSGTGHGTAQLELAAAPAGGALDHLNFHTFRSVVMALGGEDQVPSVPVDPNHGTFVVGTALYELGYDVHIHDEDEVPSTGLGPVYDEVVNAVSRRAVTEVVSFGYSHGAGSTYHLAERLDLDRAAIGTFDIVFTSYVDAVRNNSDIDTAMELRFPPSSAFHVNHWQNGTLFTDFLLDGGPVPGSVPPPDGLDVETTPWGAGATHFLVDDYDEVRDLIRTHFLTMVQR